MADQRQSAHGESDAAPSVLVVIPTYNEAANVEPIVRRVCGALASAEVLVVDDASPDGTGEIADRISAAESRVHVLHRAGKDGLGAAYVAGFGWALDRHYDVIVEMDADGSHAPEDLPRLISMLDADAGGADVVLGSRYVPGGRVVNWPWYRQFLSRGANVYSKLALGVAINDITGGYRVYRREVLAAIELTDIASRGYCFQVDLANRSVDAGFVVVEVPITFVEREAGESKMDGAVVREALLRLTQWGLRRRSAQLLSWWGTRRR